MLRYVRLCLVSWHDWLCDDWHIPATDELCMYAE